MTTEHLQWIWFQRVCALNIQFLLSCCDKLMRDGTPCYAIFPYCHNYMFNVLYCFVVIFFLFGFCLCTFSLNHYILFPLSFLYYLPLPPFFATFLYLLSFLPSSTSILVLYSNTLLPYPCTSFHPHPHLPLSLSLHSSSFYDFPVIYVYFLLSILLS